MRCMDALSEHLNELRTFTLYLRMKKALYSGYFVLDSGLYSPDYTLANTDSSIQQFIPNK